MSDAASRLKIEQELAKAQELGRWQSDDEREAEAQAERESLAQQKLQTSLRLRLGVVTIVCLLIPPLWPVALALTLYLLFPRSTSRLFVAAGLGATVLVLAMLGLSALLVFWLVMLFF